MSADENGPVMADMHLSAGDGREAAAGRQAMCLRPRPGPAYWDFLCLTCSEPIADHLGLLRRCWLRLRGGR